MRGAFLALADRLVSDGQGRGRVSMLLLDRQAPEARAHQLLRLGQMLLCLCLLLPLSPPLGDHVLLLRVAGLKLQVGFPAGPGRRLVARPAGIAAADDLEHGRQLAGRHARHALDVPLHMGAMLSIRSCGR